MQIKFEKNAKKDFDFWIKNDKKIVERIFILLADIEKNPTTGVGKPEALKYQLSGWYSRRIDHRHRLVYKIDGDTIVIASCCYHYDS